MSEAGGAVDAAQWLALGAARSTVDDSASLPGTRTARVARASRRSVGRRAKVAVRARIETVHP
ncbi:hypothetical protein SCATT_57320 [Streptantibioticus cattleyicolor NRRL 8057 = DSM 46488]|uniref:Uncharacterized protein n=1 Tax=Streptantibioticus cattleyicolor (strain ATCC 35852 / DSM 46488 / JCM 4925 / NBRC 14057 / NRRL 8057) TaxID=1003195 RepID=G8WYH2_STREN|nr:hypothetical protein SCATT_57320 [Streptantibioticus cattleyicolor NRRL 8057 = DSM 46488]